MEIKEMFNIKEDLTIEDEGLTLDFSKLESKRLDELAKKRGITVEQVVEEIVDSALSKVKKIIDEKIKKHSRLSDGKRKL